MFHFVPMLATVCVIKLVGIFIRLLLTCLSSINMFYVNINTNLLVHLYNAANLGFKYRTN